MKLMQFIYGVKLVGASLLVLMLAFLFAASLIQKTDLFQLGHLQRAVEYVREHKKSTGVIPNSNDFNRWKRNMDSVAPYSFEGYGYTLKEQCGIPQAEFCISFWTGEDFVTYYSWQPTLAIVTVNSPRILFLFLLLVVGVAGVVFGKRILAKKCG